MRFIDKVHEITSHIRCKCLDRQFFIHIDYDRAITKKVSDMYTGPVVSETLEPRVFIQLSYSAKCTRENVLEEAWKGRKWYLSEHMLEDEIVKTCYAAFEAAVKHEIMEGFTYDNVVVFNPHVDFRELLTISHKEVKRIEK